MQLLKHNQLWHVFEVGRFSSKRTDILPAQTFNYPSWRWPSQSSCCVKLYDRHGEKEKRKKKKREEKERGLSFLSLHFILALRYGKWDAFWNTAVCFFFFWWWVTCLEHYHTEPVDLFLGCLKYITKENAQAHVSGSIPLPTGIPWQHGWASSPTQWAGPWSTQDGWTRSCRVWAIPPLNTLR